jgi:hypothetical protein
MRERLWWITAILALIAWLVVTMTLRALLHGVCNVLDRYLFAGDNHAGTKEDR